MKLTACELPRTVFLKELENGPRTIEIEATEAECAAIAERLSIDSLRGLKGRITLAMPSEQDSMVYDLLFDGPVIAAKGMLTATMNQTCVVTLESFETTIESSFKGVFSNADPFDSIREDDDAEIGELPDVLGPIGDGIVDAGEVIIEQLALEIDPFPRKPDAKFEGFSSDSGETEDFQRDNPFAVLAKLKENLE